MNPEQKVCSVESARKLRELGVKQESYWTWTDDPAGRPYLTCNQDKHFSYHYAAFDVAELGEMLPEKHSSYKISENGYWYCEFPDGMACDCAEDTEAEARAKMLIHLIESGLVKA